MLDVYKTDSAVWIQPAAVDKYGRATGADTETTITGRLEYRDKIMRTPEGREIMSVGYFEMKQQPKPGDKFRIDGNTFLVLSVARIMDFGVVHWAAWFGNTTRV